MNNKTSNKYIRWLILFFILQTIIANIFIAKGPHVPHRIIMLFLLFFAIKMVKIASLRVIFSVFLSFIFAADTTISTLTWLSFDSPFNDGFAISVLGSNATEVIDMTGLYIKYFILFLVMFFVFFLKSVKYTPLKRSGIIKTITLAMIIILSILSFNYVKNSHGREGKNERTYLLVLSRLSTYLPAFNASYILTALHQSYFLESMAGEHPDYHFSIQDTGIDTYVLVIGESERVENMGIYGYDKDTTPQLAAQKDNVMLFRHAISGAPTTNLAIPLALSAATVDNPDLRQYSDNVINIANAAGFYTSWISAQTAFGSKGAPVTSIAYNAQDKLYLTGYDEKLLVHFKEVLNRKEKKKFIVLHLYGSHEPQCKRFPASKAIFNEKNDGLAACYDNSVYYTDSVLGNIFSLLKDRNASVFYFSDHALEKDESSSIPYFHGGVNPSKEAYKVPMFIWYSPIVNNTFKGKVIDDWVSTSYNDLLMKSWMGIDSNNDFYPIIKQQTPANKVLNSASSILYYPSLRERFVDE